MAGYDKTMETPWPIWTAVGYFCGSFPTAFLIGWAHGIDVRQVGSGNVGATNIGRSLGKAWGLCCFAVDTLKGFVPVLAGGIAMGFAGNRELTVLDAWQWLTVALAAMLGHMFPLWLGGRGGKGVATGFGAILGFWPLMTVPAAAAVVTWVIVLAACRFVSLASMIAAVALTIYVALGAVLTGRDLEPMTPFLIVSGSMALLIVVRHRTNLARIFAGTEPRISRSKLP